MQHISIAQRTHGKSHSIKNTFAKKVTYLKEVLNNEHVQKIVLFTTILGLLLAAANLDAFM